MYVLQPETPAFLTGLREPGGVRTQNPRHGVSGSVTKLSTESGQAQDGDHEVQVTLPTEELGHLELKYNKLASPKRMFELSVSMGLDSPLGRLAAGAALTSRDLNGSLENDGQTSFPHVVDFDPRNWGDKLPLGHDRDLSLKLSVSNSILTKPVMPLVLMKSQSRTSASGAPMRATEVSNRTSFTRSKRRSPRKAGKPLERPLMLGEGNTGRTSNPCR